MNVALLPSTVLHKGSIIRIPINGVVTELGAFDISVHCNDRRYPRVHDARTKQESYESCPVSLQ